MPIVKEEKYIEEISSVSKTGIIIDKSLNLGHIWKANLIIKMIEGFDADKYVDEIIENLK